MFCAVCRIDGNATGRTVEGTGNAGRRTLAPMCPADRNATGRTARGTGTRRQIGTANRCRIWRTADGHGQRQTGTGKRDAHGRQRRQAIDNGGRVFKCRSRRVKSHCNGAADRQTVRRTVSGEIATGRTARGTGQAGRGTVAPMCPADRNATAGGCGCAHGRPSGGEIGHGAHGCRIYCHGKPERPRLSADRPHRCNGKPSGSWRTVTRPAQDRHGKRDAGRCAGCGARQTGTGNGRRARESRTHRADNGGKR